MNRLIGFALAGISLLGAINAQATALSGSLGIAENSCVESIYGTFLNENCSFSGGANVTAVGAAQAANWVGPLNGGGFYPSIAASPGFVTSTQTGVDDAGVALNTFQIGVDGAPGDGKVAPSVTADVSINAGVISGTITFGAGTRAFSTGGSLAGGKTAYESFTSVVHTIIDKAADSTTVGASTTEYIFGAQGFPQDLCTGTVGGFGIGDCFGSEMAHASDLDGLEGTAESPWVTANGGTGRNGISGFPQPDPFEDIVSFDAGQLAGFFDNAIANIGVMTDAVYTPNNAGGGNSSRLDCSDTGLDPKEAGDPPDDVTDCEDSAVSWGLPDPDDPSRSKAAFDNMVMKVITDNGTGEIISLDTYYTNEYLINIPVGSTGANSWQGGRFQLTAGVIPVPAAVWLFGSALGLLGWIRRRAMA